MPIKISKTVICKGALFLLLFVSAIWVLHITVRPSSAGPPYQDSKKEIKREMQNTKYQSRRDEMRREMQDRAGGLPPEILAQQSNEKVEVPTIDEAVKIALAAAEEAALPLIDTKFHNNGKTITVPDDYKSIQAAINAAGSGDVVLVKPGTYYELLVMKDGVKVVSDSADGGDELVPVEGAMLKLPRRALRTIIDGSKSKTSHNGMFDFNPGVGRNSIIDGFTIENLPGQNHHIPGHAHGLNVRGASPVITNCLIRNNGSTGIGNHVVYHDQDSPMPNRDFRWANIKHRASAVIFHNIIYGNLGLGIGCNHFSDPYILGNEVFNNSDAELGDDPSPGMGNKHGSAATIIGNINHDNPGGGILCKVGAPQGKYHIDRPTHPTIMKNVIYDSGSIRPGISCDGSGSETMPVKIIGNYVYNSGLVGIGLQKGAVGIIEDNMVAGSKRPGIAVNGSTVLRLNRNKVTDTKEAPGFVIVDGAKVREMIGNASDSNQGPRFVLGSGTYLGETGAPSL
ncbi:right-handed parallel beta-helix repeat-containing protein [Thermodesulfobacteriota bacterium]